MSQSGANTLIRLVILLVLVAVILSLIGIPQGIINIVVGWFASAIVGAVLSLVAASLLEAVTGDYLKRILITVEVYGIKFSVSLFFVATLILKFFLFH